MAKRSPLKVLLFLILLLVVAYLFKRGCDGFYVTTTTTSTTSSSYIISNVQPGWAVWDIPIPKKPGTYNFSAVADNNNSKYMSWSSTVSENGTFNVMNFTSTNVGGSERPWLKPRITWTDTLDRSFIPKWDFPSSVNPTKYWSLDFNYNYSEATYILTMTPPEYPIAPPPPPPVAAVAACPACPACNSCAAPKACVDMTPYMLKAKCLLTDDDQNPEYMLIQDCMCSECKMHRQS
jgi:hypothetical protein